MTDEAKNALVDARGMNCPIPLLKARQALMILDSGDTVTVLATDPAASGDFEAFAEESGHELVEVTEADQITKLILRKC